MTILDLLQDPHFPQKPILETLIRHRTGLSKEKLFMQLERELTTEDIDRVCTSYNQYVIDKKPLEYILGYVEFAKLRFEVTPATIIPRPETEYMIEAVREFLEGQNDEMMKGGNNESLPHFHNSTFPHFHNFTLLDIGTGSGVLGLATLYHCGKHISQAYLTDLSTEALDVAKKNYETLFGVPPFVKGDASEASRGIYRTGANLPNVSFLQCSLLDDPILHDTLSHPTKEILLVANLPYIPDELYATNAPESLTKWEPKLAFVGGEDGLDFYRQMFDQLLEYTKKSPLTPLYQRGEWYELFEKEQLQKRGLTRVGGHQPYNMNLKERAKLMRTHMTATEKYLWKAYLQQCGKTVQRQKIIDHFIVDFYIAQHRLAIEVDGRSHDTSDAKAYDEYRTQVLNNYGVRVIRFTNEQALYHLDTVIQQLEAAYTLPPLGKGGEGGFFAPPTQRGAGGHFVPAPGKGGAGSITMFLEMMTRQGKILTEEYKEHFTFEEIKTFHGNIRILKGTIKEKLP